MAVLLLPQSLNRLVSLLGRNLRGRTLGWCVMAAREMLLRAILRWAVADQVRKAQATRVSGLRRRLMKQKSPWPKSAGNAHVVVSGGVGGGPGGCVRRAGLEA